MTDEEITFSFGQNWQEYLQNVTELDVDAAVSDIREWLGDEPLDGKTVLDIGCGSGIHSLAFFRLHAKIIDSFDYDKNSVTATQELYAQVESPETWRVFQGSVLDKDFLNTLQKYDIVYSWGVLHHTGNMWMAIENAASRVNDNGVFWISIYAKGQNYLNDLQLKRNYNAASWVGKKWFEYIYVFKIMGWRLLHLKNPITWNQRISRGMDIYHDMVDWLGGLPYEVASEDEIVQFCAGLGFILQRIKVNGEGRCNIYVFKRL